MTIGQAFIRYSSVYGFSKMMAPFQVCGCRIHQAASLGFQKDTGNYERCRPGYGNEPVKQMVRSVLEGSKHSGYRGVVLEVGAGTGKLTRSVAPLIQKAGFGYLAVEPVEGMRCHFQRLLPKIRIADGTGDSLPVVSGQAAGILVGQAFHWMATPDCVAEFHRVLRVGAPVCLVWNEHDTRVPWVRELQEQIIVPAYPADVPRQQTRLWKAAFEDFIPESFSPLEKQLYTFEQEYTTDTLIGRVLSTSVIASKSDEEKKSISDRVLSLVQRHPEIADKATFMLPHQTVLYVTNKLL